MEEPVKTIIRDFNYVGNKANGYGAQVPIFHLYLEGDREVQEFWGNNSSKGIRRGYVYVEPTNGSTPTVEPE